MTRITDIQHSSHPHQLTWMGAQAPYHCNGCKEEGFEPCYQCEECDFHLHEQCGLAARGSILPHPFEKSKFKFYGQHTENGMNFGFCVACGQNIRGFMYESSCKKPVRIHPCCLKLQQIISVDGVTLELREKISRLSKACLICQTRKVSKEIRGWAYVSKCGNFCCHVACFKAMTLKNWKASCLCPETDGSSTFELKLGLGDANGTGHSEKWLGKMKFLLQIIIGAILGEGISVIVELLFA
ncbi:uncharacterized protein LOC132188508 isoform X2 [Corylus avellana]|nr:uncharacterized protein LOC132188508 isoform X2 [Corylus avellana]XP_059458970.1 uncharacterized protein LOC132188508 isoform X2 [Corylus avellana]XP_059458971.1 uncharacterized protein LOC132188508 isoform X2 [Corylus avellana]